MRTRTKETLDPGAKSVDIYMPVQYLRTLVFDDREALEPELITLCLDALIAVSRSGSKRIRDRELPVRLGPYTNRLGMRLLIVALPYELHAPAFSIFYELLSQHPQFNEVNYCSTSDFNPKPFCKYSYGKIIWYADPFSRAEDVRLPARSEIQFEIRSCELASKAPVSPYSVPERPKLKASDGHDEASWSRNRDSILEFVFGLKGPCGYRRLAKIVQEHFGIAIYEESAAEFNEYGLIRLSSPVAGKLAAVRILVQTDIDERLKYVALGHELAHYVLHFPLLLLSQMIEQLSWSIPELGAYYSLVLTSGQPSPLQAIENQTDELTSFFLIPPWVHPVKKIVSCISEDGSSPTPEEMIWRFLQPLFPWDRFAEQRWKDLDEIKRRASLDSILNSATLNRPEDLFARMFGAALRAERTEWQQLAASRPADAIIETLSPILISIAEMDHAAARRCVAEYLGRELEPATFRVSTSSLFGDTFGREIIPPLDWNGVDLYPRLPLEPAIYNLEGLEDGDWHLKTRRHESPAGTVSEWREFKRDHGIALYRLESWQKKYLGRL